jgi:hypothetical protein
VALSQQVNVSFYGKGNEGEELGTGTLFYIRESYEQLRELSLLVK